MSKKRKDCGGLLKWVSRILVVLMVLLQEKPGRVGATELSSWMKDIHEDLKDVPINQLAIPGSHNSGAYWLDEKGPLASDQPQLVKTYVKQLGDLAKQIVKKFSITQTLDITQQLQAGIRLFDIRAAILNNDFHVYHGLYGNKLAPVLQDMNTFLDENNKEVIFLGMNRRHDFSATNTTDLANLITDIFGDKLFPVHAKGIEVTLNDVWAANKQVFVFFPESGNYSFWPLTTQDLPWFNVQTPDKLISRLEQRFQSVVDGKLNIFQAILSADEAFIQSNIGTSLAELAAVGNKAVADWLDDIYDYNCYHGNGTQQKNVTMLWTDFVGDSNIIPSKVIRLNKVKQNGGCVSGCHGYTLSWLLFVVGLVSSFTMYN